VHDFHKLYFSVFIPFYPTFSQGIKKFENLNKSSNFLRISPIFSRFQKCVRIHWGDSPAEINRMARRDRKSHPVKLERTVHVLVVLGKNSYQILVPDLPLAEGIIGQTLV